MEVPYSLVQARFKNSVKRSKKYKHPEPIENVFRSIVEESDGKCFYCGVEMICDGEKTLVFSIDHKIPLCYEDGSNDKSNLCVVCHRCNIVKGTMRADTFIEFVKVLRSYNERFFHTVMFELYPGRMAEKNRRIKHEGMMFPLIGDEIVKFM